MNSIDNPFAPGAGSQPPELAGREDLLEKAHVATERVRRGRSAQSLLMVGLRGVGKTVLLDKMRSKAEESGFMTIRIEAPENRSLPGLLAPQLRVILLQLSRNEKAKAFAERALSALAGFAKALKFKFEDIEVGLDFEPEAGLADNGDLEHDLQMLFEAAGKAAQKAQTAIVLFIDELQYVEERQLEALIVALHRINQEQLPVILIGAGLPQLRGKMGNAKSYAERLFLFPEIGPLEKKFATAAIKNPIESESATIEDEAIDRIFEATQGYPYFLQVWGKLAWNAAESSKITRADVEAISTEAFAALDESFFLVRFDRLTPKEKLYMRAMAELGPGPHRSGDISDLLDKKVNTLGPLRANLIQKGMIWSPNHGDTAFTVPLFDEFMKRIMPNFDPKD